MMMTHIWLAFSWLIYVSLHSILASVSCKQWFRSVLGQGFRYYRLGYTLFAFAGLIFLVMLHRKIQSTRVFAPNAISWVAGSGMGLIGLIIMLICIRKYFMNLSGFKSLFMDRPAAQLEISGVHRYVRHPLYLGTFLFIWGGFLCFPLLSLLIACLIITCYTLLALRWEEAKLVMEFGDEYTRYQRDVPALLPSWKKGRQSPE